ncbi:hypothetical protein F53441_6412 [Fusarium austroafricanum]|uniref:DM13 domain-containing protein n=1 Tax=Fusarium austroafricanum TaxID=2364996 RepID=A0A8H4KIM6_9HYPO|nr:hypothetical protein F53441_6412 [Fusarium austroafricanum]
MALKLTTLLLLPLSVMAAMTGDSGDLSSLDGGLGGTASVVSNTELKITDYKLKEASAPALYWWGSKTKDLSSGFRINNERVSDTSSGKDIAVKLDAGYTAKDFAYVGLWCEKFHANFGQTQLTSGGGSSKDSDKADTKSDDKPGVAAGLASGQPATIAALLSVLAFTAYFS